MAADTPDEKPRYDIDVGIALPPLAHIAARRADVAPLVDGEVVSEHVDAMYFDTTDDRLARSGILLRRRTGADHAGWDLAIPGREGRLPFPLFDGLAADTVPEAIRHLVWASTRGETLRPVARIVTDRTTHSLVDATGHVVVKVTDDVARAERLDGITRADDTAARWRVVEVVAEAPEWQDLVTEGLRHIGARETEARDELGRIWHNGADGAETAGGADAEQTPHPSPDSPAGQVVLRYVHQQLEQIITSDPLVRLDTPGSVHRMRVATRRLRSALQTFQPVLEAEVVTPLRSELRWLARELGSARDAEVMRDRMLSAMQQEDREVHLGPLGNNLDTEMSDAYRSAHDGLLQALHSERYHRLVVALHDLATDPPLTDKAERRASRVLPRRAARAFSRLDALVATAREAATSAERDTQLHEARKAAKKARYAGETMTEFFGKPAARFAVAMEKLQEELGEHQDSVVMRKRVEELARHETSTAAAFAYGRLHAHEERRGELAVERFEAAWRSCQKKSLRAWFS